MKNGATIGDAQRSIEMQARIRRNAEEHSNLLKELQEWEDAMKSQDVNLKNKTTSSSGRKEAKPKAAGEQQKQKLKIGDNQPGRDEKNETVQATSRRRDPEQLSIPPDDDEADNSLANEERRRGNSHYAKGSFDDAIKCYTTSLRFDPQSALAYSNRAMAHLKKKDWANGEDDANSALAISPTHIKSYQRRSAARASLGKLRSALMDLSLAETEASKQQQSNVGCGGSDIRKNIASEKRRVESLLRAAMKRAPKRSIPITIEEEEGNEEEISKDDPESLPEKEEKVGDCKIDGTNEGLNTSESEKQPFASTSQSDDVALLPSTSNNSRGRNHHKKPCTWYEFESIWRSLESQHERMSFLSTVKHKSLAKLYRNGIGDVEILVGLIVAAADIADVGSDYLRCLANIKSVDIPVMMMTAVHKELVRKAIQKTFGQFDGSAGEDADDIATKLGCLM